MSRNSQGRFLLFFFPPYPESRARQASVPVVSFCEAVFIPYPLRIMIFRETWLYGGIADWFYLASAPKLCLQFIKLQWCCDWHGTEVLGFGIYNFFYSGIPGFLVILVMYLKYYLSKIRSAFLGIMYGGQGSSTDLWSAVLPEMEVFSGLFSFYSYVPMWQVGKELGAIIRIGL